MDMRTFFVALSSLMLIYTTSFAADMQIPSTSPTVSPITPPPAYVVQKLTSDAAAEVALSQQNIYNIDAVQQRHSGFVCESGSLRDYQARLNNDAQLCMARTYTQADNISAGCSSGDTINSCSRKLFDWCMNRNLRKVQRDQIVNLMKQNIQTLNNAIMFGSDKIYPR